MGNRSPACGLSSVLKAGRNGLIYKTFMGLSQQNTVPARMKHKLERATTEVISARPSLESYRTCRPGRLFIIQSGSSSPKLRLLISENLANTRSVAAFPREKTRERILGNAGGRR